MIEVVPGGQLETRHSVQVAVVDARGGLVAWNGDPDTVAFYRSAAKPFEALLLVEKGVADRFGPTSA